MIFKLSELDNEQIKYRSHSYTDSEKKLICETTGFAYITDEYSQRIFNETGKHYFPFKPWECRVSAFEMMNEFCRKNCFDQTIDASSNGKQCSVTLIASNWKCFVGHADNFPQAACQAVLNFINNEKN